MNRKGYSSGKPEATLPYSATSIDNANKNVSKGGEKTLPVALKEIHNRPYASLLGIVVNQAPFDYSYVCHSTIRWGSW